MPKFIDQRWRMLLILQALEQHGPMSLPNIAGFCGLPRCNSGIITKRSHRHLWHLAKILYAGRLIEKIPAPKKRYVGNHTWYAVTEQGKNWLRYYAADIKQNYDLPPLC